MIRMLHVSDLHPRHDATFGGKTCLDSRTGMNLGLMDLRESLEWVAALASSDETSCDLVVIPGDLWDSPRPHANEVRVVREAIISLSQAVPVICCSGNHDVAQNAQDATALECLKGLPNVYVSERPCAFSLSLRGQPVQIFCLPYPRKSGLLVDDAHKDKSPGEITALVNHGLAAILRGFHAQFQSGVPHILLAHGSVANCLVNDQPRSLAHDVLIPLDELAPFDFSALGHIHQAQPLNPARTAWYSGSLMRGGWGEEHEPKGCNIVELSNGFPPNVQFVHNPHARQYATLGYSDYLSLLEETSVEELLNKEFVWRFKAQLTAEQWQTCKPTIDRWQQETPFFQVDVEILSEDRSRDAGMAQCLNMDQALKRVLTGTMDETDIPMVLEKHNALVLEVAS